MATIPTIDPAAPALEEHLSPQQIAILWNIDESTVRRIFQDQQGVLKLGKAGRRHGKRAYITLRIPKSIFLRYHQERAA